MAADPKTRRWWSTAGLGALICLGCCLAPLLVAAGLIGGGTLLISLTWLEPVGFALIAIGMIGLLWSRWRARRRGCAPGACSNNNSASTAPCGCAST